ncbi:MAG: DUF302 domain-containing protein [Gammaproteobacteria bacterium]|jgi:uncharacterized protein (DUF302 family)|nr:DUF302 domain-containing protein [Gammaproteobacteria bacterium]MBT3489664.1 DUF302 domain-containing protein [Gammaproteobacteria bacterium]MBT3718502.1 DUF302 domain-containing protein [Gammaproteobacteria bacterium]MBT3843899.1 DUF302 domain-containing protein [Gammaproteobacteria bacterium]MBT3893477.1 DUF302 domain-containing protein [Gammaproteobacteria bacterium]
MKFNNIFFTLLFTLLFSTSVSATEPNVGVFNVEQSVIKIALRDGISPQDAIDAMMSKASDLNMKNVGRQNVSGELQARGQKVGHLEVFQFCRPADARVMADYNVVYAAYMPCRISMVQDKAGRYWLVTLNLDMLIENTVLPDEIYSLAIKTNSNMLTIMSSAATGEF